MLRGARDSLAISVTMAARILAVALATALLLCVTSVHANDVSTATHKVIACAIIMLQVRCVHCIFPYVVVLDSRIHSCNTWKKHLIHRNYLKI